MKSAIIPAIPGNTVIFLIRVFLIARTINEHLKFLDVKSNDTFRFRNITFHEVKKVLVSMNKICKSA